jgi:hypothetical protein
LKRKTWKPKQIVATEVEGEGIPLPPAEEAAPAALLRAGE